MKKNIRRFLRALEDGEFHNLEDLSRKLNMPLELLVAFSNFLKKWDFADFDEEGRRVRLKPDFLELPRD
ncbi:MAG: hypothetical protein QW701_02225 [Candidatus Nezhaarchaeales archaeon]